MTRLRAMRRPIVLASVSLALLLAHHVLVRAMAHGHTAHVLLGSGNASPPTGAAALAIGLLAARFVTVVLVPGLLLGAAAEVLAYVLVGPKGAKSDPMFQDGEP